MDTYYAGTKLEIENNVKKWRQRFHIKYLLTHHGEFQIGDGEIIYLYVNWRFGTGLSDNPRIYTHIKKYKIKTIGF